MKQFLIINIGGSSTKVAHSKDNEIYDVETIRYTADQLKEYGENLFGQLDLRAEDIKHYYESYQIKMSELDGIIVRGPIIKPVDKGVFQINEAITEDIKRKKYGEHPTNLGVLIGRKLSNDQLPVYTVDLPSSDELIEEARYTGLPFIKRKSLYQALNHHAVARKYAQSINKRYEDLNLVITHLGTGTSVASHKKGKVIDVTNGLEGDGPMGLDRTGTIPIKEVLKLIKEETYTVDELLNYQNGQGGVKSYLNTIDGIEIERMIEKGNAEAKAIYHAMAFQVSKGIGAAAAALGDKPDAIIVTGGLAHSKYFTKLIIERVKWMSDIQIMPEESEIDALVSGVLEALESNTVLNYK